MRATVLRGLHALLQPAQARADTSELPLQAELFNAEQMQRHGKTLAELHRLSARHGRDQLLLRLGENERLLQAACTLLREEARQGQRITPAGEWLLDNFYLIEEQILTARSHFSRRYGRELPVLADGPSAGLARVYDMALEVISHGDGRIDPENLNHFVAAYQSVSVLTLGEQAVLQESLGFLQGRALGSEEDSYYDLPVHSPEQASLYVHCVRAIRHGLRRGVHGLPLMGSGDWNDGMNLVGLQGRGESVWLAFFLVDTLERFAPLAEGCGDAAFAQTCRSEAVQLRQAIEDHGWDRTWYRRAYCDDCSPLGSAASEECQIDSIAQSWAVLSGVGAPQRQTQAMQSLQQHLVRPAPGLIALLSPPFDTGRQNPGYIKGYLPGVRENGGQYTHAAIWAVMAFARLGQRERTWDAFALINPLRHGSTPQQVQCYQVEPYVVAADVYALAPHEGRGGWTWYTGSASWMYRLVVESLLGLTRQGQALHFAPCLHPAWKAFSLDYCFGSSHYAIEVQAHAAVPALQLHCDAELLQEPALPLQDDGQQHRVLLELPD